MLYRDSSGWWAHLSHLYASRSSDKHWLVARHPENTVEDIIGRYCPQCSTRYTGDDAVLYQNRCMSCYQCPLCTSPLCVVAVDTMACAFQCGYCLWRSDCAAGAKFIAPDKRELETLVLTRERESAATANDIFLQILAKYSSVLSSEKDASSSAERGHRWGIADLEQRLESAQGHFCGADPDSEAVAAGSLPTGATIELPQRVKLHTKRTLRSKLDVQQGRMKILVQPKPNPLDGDSSQKNRGAWWVKESSAVHELPR